MGEKVKELVLQLGDIVRKQTKGYYPDVNEALKSLQDYVQETTASKSDLEDRLNELEDMLTKKSERKKPFIDQIQKIRKALRVQRKATAKATRSKEEKSNESSPQTTFLQAERYELTQTDETTELSGTIKENEEQDIRRLKTENQYLRKTLDGLHKYIIGGDERALNELKTPKHMTDNQSVVEVEANVKEVTQKFLETQTETRRLQMENKYLKLILDDLHKSVIVGEATLQMELKPPKDIKNDKLLMELTANTRKIHLKFYELETELYYIHRTISQLTSMIVGDDRRNDPIQERTIKFTATGRQPKRNPAKTFEQREQSSKIDKDIELVTSVWRDLKEKEIDLDHAYTIIGEIHNQVMAVDVVQAQERLEQPTTTSFKTGNEGTRPTVPMKTEHEMKAEQEKKVRTASPLIQKRTDTTSRTEKENQEKDQTVPTKTEPNRAQEIEMQRRAVSSALNKLKDTKGALERSSKIIQELYSQVMEVSDDQGKTKPLMNTTPNKRDNDTGQTTVQEIEPDIGKELEMKAATVSAAFKKMKDTKGDLERVSKIIEDLYNRVMEVNVDQSQDYQETPTTTGFKKSGVDKVNTVPKRTVPDMTPKLEKGANDVSSPSTTRINTTSGFKKGTQETKQAVPTEIEPDNGKELEMKAAALSEALKKIKDRKGDLERMSKIIEDLHNQAKEINVGQAKEKQETLTTTGFKKGGVDMGSTVPKRTVTGMTQKQEKSASDVSSPSKKTIDKTSGPREGTQETERTVPTTIEPDIRKELEMKAAEVSEALKKIKDTKREAEYAACLLEELSRFSHATNKEDNDNVLIRPLNVETAQDFKGKDAKNVENPRQKPPQCVHDENLEKSYKFASHVLKDMRESERLRIDLKIKKAKIEELETELKSMKDENTKLIKEADSLRTRLSEHAGALLNHDNPAIADLSDPNRATKLAEKYLQLYDNQWTDAFCKLQTEYSRASDEELTGHLYHILVDGYVFCKDARQAQIFNLQDILFNPTGDSSKSRRRPIEKVGEILPNHLSDAAKLSSEVTSGNIAKAFVTKEGTKQKHEKMIKLCNTYIQECLQLCWYMQVQTPPLCLDLNTAKGHAFEKNSYKEYTSTGKKIAFVVWPALFLHENGPLLSKGVAQGTQ